MLSDAKFLEPSTTLTLELRLVAVDPELGSEVKIFSKEFTASTNSNYVWTSDEMFTFNQVLVYTTTQAIPN